ncbi:MAG: iron-sulfur cluster repair di-iron protein [Flavobacteriia bacterium]|nr:iron-sulfur cluster repair di-iron protein [Flavobacteriia bacterium]
MENNIAIEKNISDYTIGELVAQDFRKAEVFKRHGIDFCCRGNVSIDEACAKKNIDAVQLKAELAEIDTQIKDTTIDFNTWDLSDLANHIVDVHHHYVTQSIPVMYEFMNKVCRVHGDHNPELHEISKYFSEVAEELTMHMPKEEMILFPYIKQLNEANKLGLTVERPGFGTIQNPIKMMEMEHISAGNSMEKAKELSNNFTPPEHACATYRVLFSKLAEFEEDLHHHIHLENNILFKKAIEIENNLFNV